MRMCESCVAHVYVRAQVMYDAYLYCLYLGGGSCDSRGPPCCNGAVPYSLQLIWDRLRQYCLYWCVCRLRLSQYCLYWCECRLNLRQYCLYWCECRVQPPVLVLPLLVCSRLCLYCL